MDSESFKQDLIDLESTIDGLETSLEPLLASAVSTTASKIPLLDKAKLYTLTTYAIESLLFSSIRLQGVDAKDHAVFTELARIKGYFDKIKAAENAGVKPATRLDKDAAGRMIKHGLAGNDRGAKTGAAWAGSKRKFDDDGTVQSDAADDIDGAVPGVEDAKAARKAARKADRRARKGGKS